MAEAVPIALVQLRSPDNQAEALAHCAPLIREAAAGGAKLILTPEGTNILERSREKRLARVVAHDQDPCVAGLRDLAAELGVWLLIGSAIVRGEAAGDDRAANRSLLVGPDGTIHASYDKLHVFDVDLPTGERHRESESIRPGEKAVVAETPFGKLGLTVCYDVRFPQLFRALALAGAEMISVPAAFTVPTGQAHWELMLRARAVETGAFVLAPAQGGAHADGRKTWGHSLAVAPWGEVIARLDHDEPAVLHAALDLDQVARARAAIPQLQHAREFVGP
jgi:predicted amidohydrolase